MKRPKRIVFTAATKINAEGALALLAAAGAAAEAVSCVIESMRNAIGAAERLGRSIMASPEFQQEAKMQQLYFKSWQANELTDTLHEAGIAAPY